MTHARLPFPPLRGALYALAAFGLYSLSDITTKFPGASYSPAQILFFSGMAGFPLVVALMLADREGGWGDALVKADTAKS